jgi:hypothetical protein
VSRRSAAVAAGAVVAALGVGLGVAGVAGSSGGGETVTTGLPPAPAGTSTGRAAVPVPRVPAVGELPPLAAPPRAQAQTPATTSPGPRPPASGGGTPRPQPQPQAPAAPQDPLAG